MGRLPTGGGPHLLVIDPAEPKIAYSADDVAVYRSEDAGWTWQPAGEGLPEQGVAALAPDPRQSGRLFVVSRTGELYVSQDGANTWRPLPGADGGGS